MLTVLWPVALAYRVLMSWTVEAFPGQLYGESTSGRVWRSKGTEGLIRRPAKCIRNHRPQSPEPLAAEAGRAVLSAWALRPPHRLCSAGGSGDRIR